MSQTVISGIQSRSPLSLPVSATNSNGVTSVHCSPPEIDSQRVTVPAHSDTVSATETEGAVTAATRETKGTNTLTAQFSTTTSMPQPNAAATLDPTVSSSQTNGGVTLSDATPASFQSNGADTLVRPAGVPATLLTSASRQQPP